MSVFRFEATPPSSTSGTKRTKAKCKESRGPTFAFSTSPSLLREITLDKSDMGMRNSGSSGLTMKEYEEQLKKLTAENFNLKLRVYFVEERLSKVTGISDKEDLIKKNIQLKVTCESQIKELEKKQELLFEASKAFELLQKEHTEEIEKILKEKDKDIADLEEKVATLEAAHNEIKVKFPNLANLNDPDVEFKTFEDYEKQVNQLESNLREEEERYKELENVLKDNQLEVETYQLKTQRVESELEQRVHRIEELVDELEQKEHDLASANFRIRKLEDEIKSKEREYEIMKERIDEKNKTIDSLKNSLAARDESIEILENRIAKERSSSQSLQSKLDSISFQNARLKEELDILQSRLRRTTESLSPRGKGRLMEEEVYKQKYEELIRAMDEQEAQHAKRLKELEEKLFEKDTESEDYQELFEKHKKLEDDHRKACTALKNFIKRSSEEKKEREALNHMLNSHVEVIADLKDQLDRYRNGTATRLTQDDKLSLAETGDDTKFGCTAADKNSCCDGKDAQIQLMSSKLDQKENLLRELEEKLNKCTCGIGEKMEKVSELEAEVVVLERRLEDGNRADEDEEAVRKELLNSELEIKKWEIEKLNAELKRRNVNLQEVVNKELWDKNRLVEKLEKKLAEVNERNQTEIFALKQEIIFRDQQLRIWQNKEKNADGITDILVLGDGPTANLCRTESASKFLMEGIHQLSFWLKNNGNVKSGDAQSKNEDFSDRSISGDPELECGGKTIRCPQVECCDEANEKADKSEAVKREVGEVCSLLSVRLEELAAFLDSLLANSDLLSGIGLKKRQDIKQAMEKSRELSRHLSVSFGKGNPGDSSFARINQTSICGNDFPIGLGDSFFFDCESSGISMSRDKVISEQTIIINRLRDQLKLLNQEIKQRDIELSRCQGNHSATFLNVEENNFAEQGIESERLSICQELSDEDEREKNDGEEREKCEKPESIRFEKPFKKYSVFGEGKNNSGIGGFQETSESEAWSEPDRSVSLARMGRLEDAPLSVSNRNSKCDDSSESSEETLNENPRTSVSGKRCRSSETEIRRLQDRIKAMDEVNESLRIEINLLKSGKAESGLTSKIQSNEEANLAEKLKKTMDRLEECSLTCQQLEGKLATALEHASVSTIQLTKATETVTELEKEIGRLKEEIDVKSIESEGKTRLIEELENKLEEITIESELKIIEAVKQKEEAERKTFEVECRLKDAENMSREVESRVTEIEKKISETKKFKKETVLHFKEAEKHVDTAEKMMEEAERMKLDAERKSKDFQSFIDLMRKEVEDKMKEAEKRVKKTEREKDDLEKQVSKLKKKLMEAEKNKTEVEMKVKEGKETIQCMEEKLKELEVAMDQCNEEAQRRIKEVQKKADAKILELEMRIEEREWMRKTETEKKMVEAEKISRELEIGFKKQLEDAEKKVKKAKETAESAIKKVQEDSQKQQEELMQKLTDLESEKEEECAELRRQLDEVRLEASEFELELTKLTNEKIYLEEELKRMLDKECALVKDNREIRGKYEMSIHELENKLTKLAMNKTQLASRLEEIESTNIDLVSRISAIRGKETTLIQREFISTGGSSSSPVFQASLASTFFPDIDQTAVESNANKHYPRQGSAASDPGEQFLPFNPVEAFFGPRRNMNSSPDLGIESDPGRFSSLEANQQISGDTDEQTKRLTEASEVKKLEFENAELKRRLVRTRQALEETLTQLSAANQRKKQVERAICKQLHKTHHILKKARVNFESQDGDTIE